MSERFLLVLKRGGLLYVHSKTLREMKTLAEEVPSLWLDLFIAEREGRVVANDIIEPGMLCAVDVDAVNADHERWLTQHSSPPFVTSASFPQPDAAEFLGEQFRTSLKDALAKEGITRALFSAAWTKD